MKKDWNTTMTNWKVLYQKLLSIEEKLKKLRKKEINKLGLIKHIDDCIAIITCDIRRVDIDAANKGIQETNILVDTGHFLYLF
jgi:hypothetical protein